MLAHAAAGEEFAWPVDEDHVTGEDMERGGPERSVRGWVLRHLLVEATWPVHAKGVRLRGVRVLGGLDLESANGRCPLVLSCSLVGTPDARDVAVVLNAVSAPRLCLTHCCLPGIRADQAEIIELDLSGSVMNGFTAVGAVHLRGATVAGQLSCGSAQPAGVNVARAALSAVNVRISRLPFLPR
jgi:hypothetical protein